MQFFHLPVCYQEKMHIFNFFSSTNTERKWKRQQHAAVNLQLHNKIMLKTNLFFSFIYFLFEKSLLYCLMSGNIAIKCGEISSFFSFFIALKFAWINMKFLCLMSFPFFEAGYRPKKLYKNLYFIKYLLDDMLEYLAI